MLSLVLSLISLITSSKSGILYMQNSLISSQCTKIKFLKNNEMTRYACTVYLSLHHLLHKKWAAIVQLFTKGFCEQFSTCITADVSSHLMAIKVLKKNEKETITHFPVCFVFVDASPYAKVILPKKYISHIWGNSFRIKILYCDISMTFHFYDISMASALFMEMICKS